MISSPYPLLIQKKGSMVVVTSYLYAISRAFHKLHGIFLRLDWLICFFAAVVIGIITEILISLPLLSAILLPFRHTSYLWTRCLIRQKKWRKHLGKFFYRRLLFGPRTSADLNLIFLHR